MKTELPDGVFPTMVTPFKENYTIDYKSLENLVHWYKKQGIDGLFAVCQSSAMFELSSRERKELCTKVVDLSEGKYPVIASGHVSDTIDDQLRDLADMAEAGADALVLVSNRLALSHESDRVWYENLEYLMRRLPEDHLLGFYECPHPYKRVLSIEQIKWLIDTGRFGFVKDTCCDPETIRERGETVKGSRMKLYNANAATLLHSLIHGYAGYSGVMANFHGNLYYWMCKNWQSETAKAEELQNYLGVASIIEYQAYPMNAKYFLKKEGVINSTLCRRADVRGKELTSSQIYEVDQFIALSEKVSRDLTG